jgi:hypothetical protein
MDSILRVRAEGRRTHEYRRFGGEPAPGCTVVSKDLLSKLQNIDYTQAISQPRHGIVRVAGGAAELRAHQRLSLFNSL